MKLDNNKKCPFCGNKNIQDKVILKIDNEMQYVNYCNKCKKDITDALQKKEEQSVSDKEWLEYKKEFDIDWDVGLWHKYIWTRNKRKDIIPDVSDKNIERCQKIYD